MKRVPFAALAHEIAGAAAGSRIVALRGHAQAGDGLVDGGDDGGRGVEGVEGGALGAVVFLGREQRFQLLAEGLPAGILVAAGDRIGEDRQGDRPEAGEAGERLLLLRCGGPLLLLDGLQRADGGDDVAGLGFLAAGDGRRWRQVLRVGRNGRVGSSSSLVGGGGVRLAGGRICCRRRVGLGSGGWVGGKGIEQRSAGLRDAFSRATYDGG